MDFVKGPTDNLYKFIAISGLGLFIVGIVMWSREGERWGEITRSADLASRRLEAGHELNQSLGEMKLTFRMLWEGSLDFSLAVAGANLLVGCEVDA